MKNKPNFFFDNRGFPNWGDGGGLPLGNFSHIIPFFSDNVFYSDTGHFQPGYSWQTNFNLWTNKDVLKAWQSCMI